MILEQIKDALEPIGLPIYYGMAGTLDGEDPWDYIVFFRETTTPSSSKTGLTDAFSVAIVQEDFVSDEFITKAIKALTDLPGVRLSTRGVEFDYTNKPNTSAVIELAVIHFVRPSRVCRDGN